MRFNPDRLEGRKRKEKPKPPTATPAMMRVKGVDTPLSDHFFSISINHSFPCHLGEK